MRGEGGVGPSGRGALHSRQGLAWLLSIVNLTTSGRSYNLEMGRTPLGYFLPCVKWVDPLLVRAFEVGKHSPLIQILDTSLIRATPSARSLYKDNARRKLLLFAWPARPCLHCFKPASLGFQLRHWSCRLNKSWIRRLCVHCQPLLD